VARYRAAAVDLSISGFGFGEWTSEPKLSVSEPIFLHDSSTPSCRAMTRRPRMRRPGRRHGAALNLMAGRKIQEERARSRMCP